MATGRETPFGQRAALGHCPRCTSRLIYTVDSIWLEREVILERRCPECEYRESVVVSALGATVRYQRDTRTMLGMRLLADTLEDVPKDRPAA
jgi:DNA-directed RNA polymerase subunit RPC12/RpoP